MPRYSARSEAFLAECAPELARVFRVLLADGVDHSIEEGYRGPEAQQRALDAGRSTKAWPSSKHNVRPSKALHARPYPIDWAGVLRAEAALRAGRAPELRDLKQLYAIHVFAGRALTKARELRVPLTWGGDWDGDGDLTDQRLDDLCHWELA